MPSVISLTRSLLDIASASASAQDKQKLYETNYKLAELQQENEELRERNKELARQLERRKKLEYSREGYFIREPDGEKISPICPECYEAKGYIYLLERGSRDVHCPSCKNKYAGIVGAVEGYRQQRSF